jgi:hypothetical protein
MTIPGAPTSEPSSAGLIAGYLVPFGQGASHRVEREGVVGEEDGVTFSEVCEYPDGGPDRGRDDAGGARRQDRPSG